MIWLNVPPERCIRNVVARRRAGRDAVPAIERTVQAGHAALLAASRALQVAGVDVQRLDTVAALHHTLALLGLQSGPLQEVGAGLVARPTA